MLAEVTVNLPDWAVLLGVGFAILGAVLGVALGIVIPLINNYDTNRNVGEIYNMASGIQGDVRKLIKQKEDKT